MFLYGEKDREFLYQVFTSANLLSWHDEQHPIKDSFECPDFFQLPLDGNTNRMKWILVRGNGKYSVGEFTGTEFKEETPQFDSDSGPNFYATQTWENAPGGRRIQAAWMVYPEMPFSQQVTFPRELTLRTTPAGPRLFRQPIHELETLHDRTETWTNRMLKSGQTLPLTPAGGLFRLQVEVTMLERSALRLNVRGTEVLLTRTNVACGFKPVPVAGALTQFEVLVDRTSVEVFANHGEVSLSTCYLPTESGLSIRADGEPTTIQRLQLIHLKSAWK